MVMIEAVLLDLDDTLLQNDMARFIPRYFALLSSYARARLSEQDRFLEHLLAGTQAMMDNKDGRYTNREIFWQRFSERTGLDPGETEAFFDTFYREQFPQLRSVTESRLVARDLVRYCLEVGLKVAIATDPLFPRRAVEERLAWAGLPVSEFSFDLVTTYENMHATKPRAEYYREILDKIDAEPEQSMMVGNDWEADIVPASALGIDAFYVVESDGAVPNPELPVAYGTLDDFYAWLQAELAVP